MHINKTITCIIIFEYILCLKCIHDNGIIYYIILYIVKKNFSILSTTWVPVHFFRRDTIRVPNPKKSTGHNSGNLKKNRGTQFRIWNTSRLQPLPVIKLYILRCLYIVPIVFYYRTCGMEPLLNAVARNRCTNDFS